MPLDLSRGASTVYLDLVDALDSVGVRVVGLGAWVVLEHHTRVIEVLSLPL